MVLFNIHFAPPSQIYPVRGRTNTSFIFSIFYFASIGTRQEQTSYQRQDHLQRILIKDRTKFKFTDRKSYTTTRTHTYLNVSAPLLRQVLIRSLSLGAPFRYFLKYWWRYLCFLPTFSPFAVCWGCLGSHNISNKNLRGWWSFCEGWGWWQRRGWLIRSELQKKLNFKNFKNYASGM